jgi:hypothetical protein
MSKQNDIDRLKKRIADMEQRLEDRTFYGSVADYRCELYNLKRELTKLEGADNGNS